LLRRYAELLELRLPDALPAQPIDRAVACDRDQPRGRRRRGTGTRPSRQRLLERLLQCVLGELEVAQAAHESSEHAGPLLSKDVLDDVVASQGAAASPGSRTSVWINNV
jgi:hypothetical protein